MKENLLSKKKNLDIGIRLITKKIRKYKKGIEICSKLAKQMHIENW